MISLASSTTFVSPSQTSIDKLDNASHYSSAASSISLPDDDENVTITASTLLARRQRSSDDLQLLAASSHMTELAYSISDIQTRIFAIQELRHKAQSPSGADAEGTGATIDESLMNLDERLEAASKGMKTISDALECGSSSENPQTAALARKHATLVADWEAVQEESTMLREELKEDKWLTVFRTVTDQADGMMSSLEKAVNRCQDFIWQVHKRGADDIFLSRSTSQASLSPSREKGPPSLETFNSLLESFEAKKKHYMPATSKVLSIIDKGVQDRVTKNGETLRRHAESAQRWKNLRDRISRTDADMESVRKVLLSDAQSDTGSSISGSGRRDDRSRAASSASTFSRSISPLRKFARKLTGSTRGLAPVTPLTIQKNGMKPAPFSEPANRRQRASVFEVLRPKQPTTPITPDRPSHKYSQSLTPDSSPRGASRAGARTPSTVPKVRPTWNSSTKVVPDEKSGTIKATPPRRPPSSSGRYTPAEQGKRSLSRTSMASSRPWSPVTSSIATSNSSQHHAPLPPTFRPPSRARTPSTQMSPPSYLTPRRRQRTPSHIPAPAKSLFTSPKSDVNWDDEMMNHSQASSSPTHSAAGQAPGAFPPRPPSRSMIPVPSFQFSSASRPSSAMSENTDSYFRGSAARAQTPEVTIRAKVAQLPIYQASTPSTRSTIKLPPSSFKDNPSGRSPSRAYSRAGTYTPSDQYPVHEYVPSNLKDPLDVEIALIVNGIPHGLLIERVDPPLRTVPRDGEEIRAQYAFSNSLARKVVTCRLTTLARPGRSDPTKKVMCRVGGGWQDLQFYILNRQGGQ